MDNPYEYSPRRANIVELGHRMEWGTDTLINNTASCEEKKYFQ